MASATWSSIGPASTRCCRSRLCKRTLPTLVGLASRPHGPGPRSPDVTRRIRSAATSARAAASNLAGAHRRSATESTAGNPTWRWAKPSSRSQPRRNVAGDESSISSVRTPLANGHPSNSATSGPTCPVSSVDGVEPGQDEVERFLAAQRGDERPAVARVSEPAKASSQISTPSEAPAATASRTASSAAGGPRLNTTHLPPSAASSTPLVIARRQYGLISRGTPVRTRRPSGPSSSSSATGICLMRTATLSAFTSAEVAGRPTVREPDAR